MLVHCSMTCKSQHRKVIIQKLLFLKIKQRSLLNGQTSGTSFIVIACFVKAVIVLIQSNTFSPIACSLSFLLTWNDLPITVSFTIRTFIRKLSLSSAASLSTLSAPSHMLVTWSHIELDMLNILTP